MTDEMPLIPRFEPEAIQAEADRRWRGDHDKVATTSLKSLTVRGVLLQSRYGKADEYEGMARMVIGLPDGMAGHLHSIFCDSNSLTYSVSMPDWDEDLAYMIGTALEEACFRTAGGHNGIWISHARKVFAGHDAPSIEIAAAWTGDLDE